MSTNQTYAAYLSSVNTTFLYYSLWLIWPVAVVGNLVSLYIYTRPNLNKKTNTGFLYGWLCVINVIAVLEYTFVYRSQSLIGYKILTYPCGFEIYLHRTFLNSIAWMQVLISLDRFVVIMYPRKAKWFNRKK